MAPRSHTASSSRRKRLLLLEAGSHSMVSAAEPLAQYDEPPQPTFIQAYVPPVAPPASESIDRSFSADELDVPMTIPYLVSRPVPVSWLFVGDSFTPKDVTEPRPWRVYTNRFAGVVRAHFQRPKDVFIDATFPSARLSEVLFDFERRIAKFEPDICFVSLSITEADTKSVDRFEKLLVRLIRWSKDCHCQLVVQTPPCLPSRTDAELTRRLILIETIRGIAAEHATPLVDHWEHWEWATSQIGQTETWFDSETHTPAEQGHRQLAKRLVQDLKLNDIPKPEFPAALDESVVLGG